MDRPSRRAAATDSVEMERKGPPSSFEVHVMGQIESAVFPNEDNLFCQFRLLHGSDWMVQYRERWYGIEPY